MTTSNLLPSWNDTPDNEAIVEFVERSATTQSPGIRRARGSDRGVEPPQLPARGRRVRLQRPPGEGVDVADLVLDHPPRRPADAVGRLELAVWAGDVGHVDALACAPGLDERKGTA